MGRTIPRIVKKTRIQTKKPQKTIRNTVIKFPAVLAGLLGESVIRVVIIIRQERSFGEGFHVVFTLPEKNRHA